MPKVSVIMNCLNGERYLKEALDSVFAQTFTDWEIIFWDNGSKDTSTEIAKSYGSKVRCFRTEETCTLGEGRNRAFKEAKGDFLAILDVDDIWKADKLQKQLELFQKESIGFTFSNSLFFTDEGDLHHFFEIVKAHRGKIIENLLNQNFISTETMIFRKSALDKMSYLFDSRFTIVCDYDLTIRLADITEVEFTEESLSKWRIHPNSESSKRPFLAAREQLLMLEALRKAIPDFGLRFARYEDRILKKANVRLVEEAWSGGDLEKARSLLRSQKGFFYGILYVMTYMYPFRLPSKHLHKMRRTLARVL